MKATKGTCHSKDMKKNDDRISAYLDDSSSNSKSNKSVLEGSLLHNIHGKKEVVQTEAISNHAYRKILGKQSSKYQP